MRHPRTLLKTPARTSITFMLIVFLLSATSARAQTPLSAPPAYDTAVGTGFSADVLFPRLRQGTVGVVRLDAPDMPDTAEASLTFQGRAAPFFPDETTAGRWYGLAAASVDSVPGDYPLTIQVRPSPDAEWQAAAVPVTVESAGYVRQTFAVPPDRAFLISPDIERTEGARLATLTDPYSPAALWNGGGFQLPINADITSGFGQFRILNATVATRHTGTDQRAPVGTPVTAMASGEVIFAGALDIRGNYLLIDHGWGVYTGYAHLSSFTVGRGDRVEQEEIIGFSGNTGRSSGAHLHWEIAVNGLWINGLDFVSMWLPGVVAQENGT